MHVDPFVTPSSAIISPNIIRYLLLVADDLGVPFERTLRQSLLTREAVDSPTLRVSYRQGRRIIEQALEVLPHPGLGLIVGERQSLTASGLLGLAMMSSATLFDAVRVGLQFQNLAGSMVRWSSRSEANSLVVTAAVPEIGSPVGRFLVEEGFANITRMVRDVAGISAPKLIELGFAHAGEGADYNAHFGCPVRLGASRNAWHLPLAAAGMPLPAADRWTHAETVALLGEQTRSIVERQELVALLASYVEDSLPEVRPLADYARLLALSERTLRRRLTEVGSSYSHVIDDVRKRLAAELFSREDLTLAEISYRLGYGDERSLRRSALRWFGRSPAAFRADRDRV